MYSNSKRSRPVAVSEILTGSQKGIREYRNRINKHSRVLLLVKKSLPPQLRDHCLACVVANNKLIVYTDSPVWASQLRFHQDSIIGGLAGLVPSIDFYRVVIRVLLTPSIPEPKIRYPKAIRAETIETLHSGAKAINDMALKKSLFRLAMTLRRTKRT